METYKIVRFYQDERSQEIVSRGLSLEQAQAHCRREDTHGPDWFDGYERDEDTTSMIDVHQSIYDGEHRRRGLRIVKET